MSDHNQQKSGATALAELMDEAHAVIHPESAELHGVTEADFEIDGHKHTPALTAASSDGFIPILLLGQGSSAEVWRCADESRYREVAVKTIRPDIQLSPEACEELLCCEAKILGKINHPGVVDVIHHGGQGSAYYLAMQFVDGDALSVHCRVVDLDFEQRLALFLKVLEIVSHLHDEGLIHGDLKPEHILIREGGYPVLVDFGLAARWTYVKTLGAGDQRIGGSGPYCPPEILDGTLYRPVPSQDIFALGVILRGLIQPFKSSENTTFYASLEKVWKRATNEEPEQRFSDASVMLTALREACSSNAFAQQQSEANAAKEQRILTNKVAVVTSLCVLTTFLVALAWFLIGADEQPGVQNGLDDPRGPMNLSQTAGILEGVLSDFTDGNPELAGERLQPIIEQSDPDGMPWEVRHVAARLSGSGLSEPFTDDPYQGPFAISAVYDPATQSVAYIRLVDQAYEVWTHVRDDKPEIVTQSTELIQSLAVAPGNRRVAGLINGGKVAIWSRPADGVFDVEECMIPSENHAKKVWFSEDGKHVFILAPHQRLVECWSAVAGQASEPLWVLDECDYIDTLHSTKGQFLVATQRPDQPTILRLVTEDGDVVRQIEMTDGALPLSADALPGDQGRLCLGMSNGYVRLHDPVDGWLEPTDLGVNQAVTGVLFSPNESRVFAAMNRVHVLDFKGRLMMRLGDRDAPAQFVTSLHYNPEESALTGVSLQSILRWSCPEKAE